MPDWILWAAGASGLLIAGVIAATRGRARERRGRLEAETARARRALSLAEAARDGCPREVRDAQRDLDDATALLSALTDPAVAVHARELAERAETRWRAASPESGPGT
ncbi:DUF6403 family protein [Blastococcus sp. Marseille-P5729]|uniref:DUF6403 family protein n=1 Tax=Blastococcus sp. Marseille-P5729 TaxID=2086582 RepID=UPI000D110959|nr:DUF6403 family protein [Blastococcus sp. Marseille-P5729]